AITLGIEKEEYHKAFEDWWKRLQLCIDKDDLWNKIQMIWNQIDVDFCLKLIDTMPQRIADVLKASGGYTKW
ncbi:13297_t:CDS:2, partial [Entrophospora sp. SA101]